MNTGRCGPGATPVDIDDSVRASGGDSRRCHFGVAGTVDHCGGGVSLAATEYQITTYGGNTGEK
jgi:hypothetical protein